MLKAAVFDHSGTKNKGCCAFRKFVNDTYPTYSSSNTVCTKYTIYDVILNMSA